LKKAWCIPPKANGEFVWKMEDVLEVYKRPYDPKRPMVCFDEMRPRPESGWKLGFGATCIRSPIRPAFLADLT